MLRLRGAVRWKPRLMNPVAVGDPHQSRWGFVPQPVIRDLLGDKSQHQRYGVYYHTDLHVSSGTLKEFERFDVDFDDFKAGAESAYHALADNFCEGVDFSDVSFTSPRLTLFLNDCLDGYEERGYGRMKLEVDQMDVVVQDISCEFGNVDHLNKIFGVYDGEEIRFHLLGGALPEVTTADEIAGTNPRRLAAHVMYLTREKCWFPDHEEKPKEWTHQVHYLEYESPMKGALGWGLRNFNKAIDTP